RGESLLQPRPKGNRARHAGVLVDFSATGAFQRIQLKLEILFVRGDPRVADQHPSLRSDSNGCTPFPRNRINPVPHCNSLRVTALDPLLYPNNFDAAGWSIEILSLISIAFLRWEHRSGVFFGKDSLARD